MTKLDNIQAKLKPFMESSKMDNWIKSLKGLCKAEGIDFVFLTRDQMQAQVESYGPDEGEDDTPSTYTYTPFPNPEPPAPLKPNPPPFTPTPPTQDSTDISSAQETEEQQRTAYYAAIGKLWEEYTIAK